MKSLAVVTGIALIASALAIQGQGERRLVSQGTYSMVGNDANGAKKVTKLDEWRMYADKDGSYSVDIEGAAQSPTIEEHFVLTNDLKPKSFSLLLSSKVMPAASRLRFFVILGQKRSRATPWATV